MITTHGKFIDLAPNISRDKLVVECIYKNEKLQMKYLDENEGKYFYYTKDFFDLEPNIVYHKLAIECIHKKNFNEDKVFDYMIDLSKLMNMNIDTHYGIDFDLFDNDVEITTCHRRAPSHMIWKENGMNVYTWNKDENEKRPNFMSINIYTCKKFVIKDVIDFTRLTFSDEITDITWRE